MQTLGKKDSIETRLAGLGRVIQELQAEIAEMKEGLLALEPTMKVWTKDVKEREITFSSRIDAEIEKAVGILSQLRQAQRDGVARYTESQVDDILAKTVEGMREVDHIAAQSIDEIRERLTKLEGRR